MANSIPFNQWTPNSGRQSVLDEKMPKPVRPLIKIGHSQIGRHRGPVLRTASPNGSRAEKRAVTPTVSFHEFVGSHPLWTEHHVGGIVEIPVLVQKPVLCLHLPEQWCAGIRGKDVKGGAFKTVLLDP